jgi:hypothetical protein
VTEKRKINAAITGRQAPFPADPVYGMVIGH